MTSSTSTFCIHHWFKATTLANLNSHIQNNTAKQLQQMLLTSGIDAGYRLALTLHHSQPSLSLLSTPPFPWVTHPSLGFFNSGASSHMTSNDSLLNHTYSPSHSHFIYTTDESHLPITKWEPLPLFLPLVCFLYHLYFCSQSFSQIIIW